MDLQSLYDALGETMPIIPDRTQKATTSSPSSRPLSQTTPLDYETETETESESDTEPETQSASERDVLAFIASGSTQALDDCDTDSSNTKSYKKIRTHFKRMFPKDEPLRAVLAKLVNSKRVSKVTTNGHPFYTVTDTEHSTSRPTLRRSVSLGTREQPTPTRSTPIRYASSPASLTSPPVGSLHHHQHHYQQQQQQQQLQQQPSRRQQQQLQQQSSRRQQQHIQQQQQQQQQRQRQRQQQQQQHVQRQARTSQHQTTSVGLSDRDIEIIEYIASDDSKSLTMIWNHFKSRFDYQTKKPLNQILKKLVADNLIKRDMIDDHPWFSVDSEV